MLLKDHDGICRLWPEYRDKLFGGPASLAVWCPTKLPCPGQVLQTRHHQVLPISSGGQVCDGSQVDTWVIQARVMVIQARVMVIQVDGNIGPLASSGSHSFFPLLFPCWFDYSGSGLLGAEPRQ